MAERQGRMAEAAACYRRAIRSKPEFATAHFNLGRVLVAGREYEAATEEFLIAVSTRSPDQRGLLDGSMAVYSGAGQQAVMMRFMKEAQARFAKARQSDMEARLAHFTRILGIAGPL